MENIEQHFYSMTGAVSKSLQLLRNHVSNQLDSDDVLLDCWKNQIMPDTQNFSNVFIIPSSIITGDAGSIQTFVEVLNDKNDKLRKNIRKCFAVQPAICVDNCKRIYISRIDWKWMFCYGGDNSFRFENDRIIWLKGRNGSGKTAFQEILVMGIFGVGIPSRIAADTGAYDFINNCRPSGCEPEIQVWLVCENRTYCLTRTWGYTEKGFLMASSIKDVTDPRAPILIGKTNTAVKNWVNRHVGSRDHFLRCVALTQYNDEDFFDMDGAKQLDVLMDDVDDDTIADKAITTGCIETLKLYVTSLNMFMKCVQASRDTISLSGFDESDDVPMIREMRMKVNVEIEELKNLLRDLRDDWHPALRATGLRDMPSACAITNKINSLEKEIRDNLTSQDTAASNRESIDTIDDQNKEDDHNLKVFQQELSDLQIQYEDMPYNNQCVACRSHPWRVRMRKLRSDIDIIVKRRRGGSTNTTVDIDALEVMLGKWRALWEVQGKYQQYNVLHDRYTALKHREADLTVKIEKRKVYEQNRVRKNELDNLVRQLNVMLTTANKAKGILQGYRCWILEHRIFPEFTKQMNFVLNSFPDNKFDVSLSKHIVSVDNEDSFLPSWRVSDGKVTLKRAGGFERAMVNCAARITLGRMFHSERSAFNQILFDEMLVSADHEKQKYVPRFLHNLMSKMGYSNIVYTCHGIMNTSGHADQNFDEKEVTVDISVDTVDFHQIKF